MATMQEIEVWVMVNADGEYDCGTDEEKATENFEANCSTDGGRQLIKITLTVPLPETIEVEGTVPDTEGTPTLTVKGVQS